jgi:tetratricopeptide (TPR) repeat protein
MDEELREKLKPLVEGKRFDEALLVLSSVEQGRRLTTEELVLKGRCIQLSSGVGTPLLSEAERSFLEALRQDQDYVPALLELGWFYHAVEDDAEKALPFFEKALATSLGELKEAIRGKKGCLEELKSSDEAEAFVRGIVSSSLREEELLGDAVTSCRSS